MSTLIKELTSIEQIKPGDIVYNFAVDYPMVFIYLGSEVPISWNNYYKKTLKVGNCSFKDAYYYDAMSNGNLILYPIFEFHSDDILKHKITQDMWKNAAKKALEDFQAEEVISYRVKDFCNKAYYTKGIGNTEVFKLWQTKVRLMFNKDCLLGNIVTLQEYTEKLRQKNEAMNQQWKVYFNKIVKSFETKEFVKYNLAYSLNKENKVVDLWLCVGQKNGNWCFLKLKETLPCDVLIHLGKSGYFLSEYILKTAFLGYIKKNEVYTSNSMKPLNIRYKSTVEKLIRTNDTVREILQQYV